MFITLSGAALVAGDDFSVRVESALVQAGDNAGQLRKALKEVPESQVEGMQFLIAYMPERDLRSLSADFLLKNVQFAYRGWKEAPWKAIIPKEIFLNDILPYSSINERRDNWREDFYRRFKPLVADAKSPTEAAVLLNQVMCKTLNVRFSRKRPKADQSPYETIKAGMASCTGLSVLLVDVCRAVGVPARFAGTPLWANKSGNHSWVEIWDGRWHYTGAGEPAGGTLDRAWFTGRAATAQRDHRLHAIYATSYKHTDLKFPLVWDRHNDYVYAVNVTDRYTRFQASRKRKVGGHREASHFDVEASLHAVDQLKRYLQKPRADRAAPAEQLFANVALTGKDAEKARQLLWDDHVRYIKETRAAEMNSKKLTVGSLQMPFSYTVFGDKPEDGRSLYISLHGGGGAPKRVNDAQWNNQKKLYRVSEGVYLAPRAPNDAWNMWHQGHVDVMFDRLIENLIVFEDVNPNRVYLLGYSAGGDGVYRLGPRMADRWAAAAMMAGHPGNSSPVSLYNTPFTIHVGERDGAYNRNKVARNWGRKLEELQQEEAGGYIHWTEIYKGKGHWIDNGASAALPWMAKHTRNPLPNHVVWQPNQHQRFYWLATNKLHGGIVRATLKGQTIELQPGGLSEIVIRVNDHLLNLDEDIVVRSKGKELFRKRVERSIAMLSKTLDERGDPASIFSAEIVITFETAP